MLLFAFNESPCVGKTKIINNLATDNITKNLLPSESNKNTSIVSDITQSIENNYKLLHNDEIIMTTSYAKVIYNKIKEINR